MRHVITNLDEPRADARAPRAGVDGERAAAAAAHIFTSGAHWNHAVNQWTGVEKTAHVPDVEPVAQRVRSERQLMPGEESERASEREEIERTSERERRDRTNERERGDRRARERSD